MNKEGSPRGEHEIARAHVEIGPGSLLWEYAGDRRMGFTGMSAGILQLMHPGIGAAISEQSDFFKDPWGRILRSVPEIIGVIYDPDGEETGKKIKGYHTKIKGRDEQDRRYNALNPETFWWPHATFHTMVEDIADRFDRRTLSSDDKEQLYRETSVWYERYGVSTKPVPKDYASFRKKWDEICDNTLELTPAAASVIDKVNSGTVERRPDVPAWMWKLGGRLPANELIRILAIGGLPNRVRERFDISWSDLDALMLKTIETTTKLSWPLIPKDFRYHPRAKKGMGKQYLKSSTT